MTAEFSDLSVGVLEGRTDKNTLIIRSKRGEEVASAAEKAGYLVLEEMPTESLEHLRWAAGNKKKRALARIQEAGRLNTAEEAGRAMVRMNADAIAAILG
jgi:coenzyme F420 hydrogenase subunit beta